MSFVFLRRPGLLIGALLVAAIGLSMLPRLQAQNPSTSQQKTFTSPDGVFRFTYPATFALYQGKDPREASYIPVCQDTGLVCVVYPPEKYKGTNFGAAAFAVTAVSDATTESACSTFETTAAGRHPTEIINGVAFKTGVTADAAMSHSLETHIYRTFHAGKCYELDINITQTSFEVYDPGTIRKFTLRDKQRVQDALKKIVGSFSFLK
jgi:hypothetical protein